MTEVADRFATSTALASPSPSLVGRGEAPWPDRDYSVPLGTAISGRLMCAAGGSRITIAGNPGTPDLWRAHFEGEVPRIDSLAGGVTIRYRRHSLLAWVNELIGDEETSAMLELAGQVPWRIDFNGGLSRCSAYLADVRLEAFRIAGGASEVEVSLSRPVGVVPIQIGNGASHVTVSRPRGSAVRLRIAGGASQLHFDEQHAGAVGGEVRWQTPGADAAPDRYEIDVAGGASDFTVDVR